MSSPAKATSRGPDRPAGTPGGRAAQVESPRLASDQSFRDLP
jgi:hypothetical protein